MGYGPCSYFVGLLQQLNRLSNLYDAWMSRSVLILNPNSSRNSSSSSSSCAFLLLLWRKLRLLWRFLFLRALYFVDMCYCNACNFFFTYVGLDYSFPGKRKSCLLFLFVFVIGECSYAFSFSYVLKEAFHDVEFCE